MTGLLSLIQIGNSLIRSLLKLFARNGSIDLLFCSFVSSYMVTIGKNLFVHVLVNIIELVTVTSLSWENRNTITCNSIPVESRQARLLRKATCITLREYNSRFVKVDGHASAFVSTEGLWVAGVGLWALFQGNYLSFFLRSIGILQSIIDVCMYG